MKQYYLSSCLRRLPTRLLLLALLLWVPTLSKAQEAYQILETMGTISPFETIGSAQAEGDFDYPELTYSGSALGSAVGGGPAGTTAPELTFGVASSAGGSQAFQSSSNEIDFVIAGLSTSNLVDLNLKFSVFAGTVPGSVGRNIANQFKVQVSGDGKSYFDVAYTAVDNSTLTYASGWKVVQVDPADIPEVDELYIRFVKVANVNRLFRLDDIEITGIQQGIAVTPNGILFSNTIVGQQSGARTITVSGAGLTGAITVSAPDGFLVRTGTNAYSTTATLPAVGGTVPNTAVSVVFAPKEAKLYDATITLSSPDSESRSVTVRGTGQAPTPQLTVAPTSVTFNGTTEVGRNSDPIDFTVSGEALASDVTISPPAANFQIRLGNTGNFTSAPITLSPTMGTLSATLLQVRFVPTTTGVINSSLSITSTGATTRTIGLQGRGTAAPVGPSVFVDPDRIDFQSVTGSGSAQTLSFEVGGTNLIGSITLAGSTNNIVFRDATAGGSFINGPIEISRDANNAVIPRRIEVRLIGPVAVGRFSGTIIASTPTTGGSTTATVTILANNTSAGESTINPSANLVSFSTVSNVPSAAQTFTVSGTNLLLPITIKAPQFFQVSTQADFAGITTTSNSITLPLVGSNVPQTTVYVRYLPATPRSEAGAFISITSSPAQDVFLALTGTSIPNVDVDNAFTRAVNVVINTKTTGQSQRIVAERVRQAVTISVSPDSDNPFNPNRTPQFEVSLNNADFGPTVTLTPNPSTFRVDQQIFVRYAPTRVGGASANLQYQSTEVDNNSLQTLAGNGILLGNSIATQPTEETVFRVSRSGDKATVFFALPANYVSLGYGENRLIVASVNAQLPPNQQPLDGRGYQTGNQVYGAGNEVAPGYFAVFAGPNSQATIEGLDLRQTYYFYIFEYNNLGVGSAENYKTPATPEPINGVPAVGLPLPVELVSFTAKLNKNRVNLTWETASEKDNKGFEVQRSQDGITFTSILFKNGQGNTSGKTTYVAVDEQPLSGVSYYRLKQIDFDGKTSLSSVVRIANGEMTEITMYPNPVQNILNVRLPHAIKTSVQVTITDLTGRVVRTEQLAVNGEVNMNSLTNGTYLVTVKDNVQKVTRRIIKN